MKAQGDAAQAQAKAQVELAKLQLEAERERLEAVKVLTSAQKTGAEIQEIMAGVRRDNVAQAIDVADMMDSRADDRTKFLIGQRRADMDRHDSERRDIRGHMMRQAQHREPREGSRADEREDARENRMQPGAFPGS